MHSSRMCNDCCRGVSIQRGSLCPKRGSLSSEGRGVSVCRGSLSEGGSLSGGKSPYPPVDRQTLLKTLPSLTVGNKCAKEIERKKN